MLKNLLSNKHKKATATPPPLPPTTHKMLRNCARIFCGVSFDEQGQASLQNYLKPVEHEQNIIPSTDHRIIYYTFYDANGTETPKRFMHVQLEKNPKTNTTDAILPLDNGQKIRFTLEPGDQILNNEGSVAYEMEKPKNTRSQAPLVIDIA